MPLGALQWPTDITDTHRSIRIVTSLKA